MVVLFDACLHTRQLSPAFIGEDHRLLEHWPEPPKFVTDYRFYVNVKLLI